MEANVIANQVKVYSHSALHSFITGPEPKPQLGRSKTSPYRKRQGLFSFLGINEVLDEVKREEKLEIEHRIAAKEHEISWNLSQVSEA